MAAFNSRLLDGRFVQDDPTDDDAPKLALILEEHEEDEFDPEEQARLDAFLDISIAAADRGETVSAEDFLAKLQGLEITGSRDERHACVYPPPTIYPL